MDEQTYSDLLDLIYGAAAQPDLWVPALERIADTLGGNSAWLSQLSYADGTGSGVGARLDPATARPYLDYYAGLNPFVIKARPREFVADWRPRISTDLTEVESDAFATTEYYNDFLRPQEIRSLMMINVAAKGIEVATINVHRSDAAGPFGAEELGIAQALHGHLIRAFKLSGVFAGLSSLVEDTAGALDRASQGMFILDADRRVRHVNRAGEWILAQKKGLKVVCGALTASEPDAARTLNALIGSAAAPDRTMRGGGSMAIRSETGAPALSVSVSPLSAGSIPIFAEAPSVLVCVTEVRREIDVATDRLRGLFGLTVAEARLAGLLVKGARPGEAAEALGVGISTIRTHLARLFEKTETANQAELSRLLMQLAAN